jgi:hypothetical protein
MADWFESRFRETVDTGPPDPAFVARMRALVVNEWQADAGKVPSSVAPLSPPSFTNADDREGDIIMLDTEDRSTGPESTTRRPSGRWIMVAAAVAVVAVVGTLIVAAGGDDENPVDTATSPTTAAAPAPAPAAPQDVMQVDGTRLELGSYVIDPSGDDTTPVRVTYDVAADGWDPWPGAVKHSSAGHALLTITTVPNLVTDGCLDHTPAVPPVGASVDDLVTALSRLAPFAVTASPTDVTAFGYAGKHLELTLPADLPEDTSAENFHDFTGCADGEVHSWISTNNDGSFYGYETPGYTEEFWILDVEGTRLVLVQGTTPGTPAEDITERDAIFDSIQIEP